MILSTLVTAIALSAPPAAPSCPTHIQGDMNGDGACTIVDAVLFNTAWAEGNQKADWNFDCAVDIADIVRFYQLLGPQGASASTIMDFNLDNQVDIADLSAFTSAWASGSSIANVSHHYDGQNDCQTDIADLILFTGWYTNGCP